MGNGHSFFFFFGWATIWAVDWAQIWQGLMGPAGPARPNGRGFGPREKNSISKRAGFGLWAKTRTRPVAIPSINGFVAVLTPKEASKLSNNKQKHHMDLFPIINLCFFFNLYLILKQWF